MAKFSQRRSSDGERKRASMPDGVGAAVGLNQLAQRPLDRFGFGAGPAGLDRGLKQRRINGD